jgi:hypothetical protein
VKVEQGGVSLGTFSPTDRIVVYGQAGDDKRHAAVTLRLGLTWWVWRRGSGGVVEKKLRDGDVGDGGIKTFPVGTLDE